MTVRSLNRSDQSITVGSSYNLKSGHLDISPIYPDISPIYPDISPIYLDISSIFLPIFPIYLWYFTDISDISSIF